ncbi:hypothetical protein, conserved [Trypanosoma brucei gambiense DAL972]|uniref:Uncharacterized protein n=1 Tax=Trypanosoma brucei gambiense (strain MHOM/CI/86/DAL972) TaxID=679716 RepID=D0A828_TRYB9|nr:hypothetical protein, conserved [Trypanosoma brucei gambiense DAL972]CBH17829.1 hypothetical protein, conserved [Trypanosoma brucei gambiense DAL972]|eukprot:XP_011780093.1 hypothetical protein, conserved [Trypanosoma brucei gambiense DAL972]
MSTLASALPLLATKNVLCGVTGSTIQFFCDLTRDYGPTSTKKSVIIASSCGNRPIGTTGAHIVLNVFFAKETKPQLDEDTLAPLRTREVFGLYCYRSVVGEKILCIEVDFNDVGTKKVGKGRGTVLATSRGCRPLGNTGIYCSFNCLRSLGAPSNLSELSSVFQPSTHPVGEKVDLGNGFIMNVESSTQITIVYECGRDEMCDTVRLRPYLLNGVINLNMCIRCGVKRNAACENESSKKRTLLLSNSSVFAKPSLTARNAKARYTVTPGVNTERIRLEVRFDPTYIHYNGGWNEPIIVSNTGGWVTLEDGVMFTFCAHRSPVSLASDTVVDAVREVLGGFSPEELAYLRFKEVYRKVFEKVGTANAEEDDMKEEVRLAIISHFHRRAF